MAAERFAGLARMPELGWDSVTVPGAVSSWVALSDRYGKLPFAALFESAVHYAEHGFLVGLKVLSTGNCSSTITTITRIGTRTSGLHPRPVSGLSVRHGAQPTIDPRQQGEDFYRGELAQLMVSASAQAGGALSLADLDQHRCEWVTPTRQSYHGVELLEIPQRPRFSSANSAGYSGPPASAGDGFGRLRASTD